MLAEDGNFQESLQRIVRSLSRDHSSHPDLMQELLIHVSQIESAELPHTWKWYLRNCWYFLHDILRRERRKDRLRDPAIYFPAAGDLDMIAGPPEQGSGRVLRTS